MFKFWRIILFSAVCTISLSILCHADTLFLKNGKVIHSENIWLDDGYFMYILYGATVGIAKDKVDRVEFDPETKPKENDFQFDVWPFGCTVLQAIDIAERNDLPLHKHGIITVNKKFHPMIRKYSDATHFYYNTNLLGHFAKVELFFTAKTKHLYAVQINWPNQKTKNSTLLNEIGSMISDKYGKPVKSGRKLFYDTTRWVSKDANQIIMKVHSTAIFLQYIHIRLNHLNDNEKQQLKVERVKIGSTKDKGKF